MLGSDDPNMVVCLFQQLATTHGVIMIHGMRGFSYIALFAVACFASGCGGDGPKGDKLIVKGKVTIDDKPGDGVTLSFYGPTDKVASGIVTTQADGSYEVMFNSVAGEGNYKVTATKMKGGSGSGPALPALNPMEGIDELQLKMTVGSSAAASAIPLRYNDINSSGLTAVLQKGKNDGKDFALKSR